MASNGNSCLFWCFPEETRWDIPWCPRCHWQLQMIWSSMESQLTNMTTFPELPINSKKEQLKLLWMLWNYNFNSRKYPSLDTVGVPREYHQIPRKFKPFDRWYFHQAKSQCKISLGLSIYWTDILQDSWNILLLLDNCVDYMLIINLNWNITNPSIFIKKALSNKIVLAYYDPTSHTTLQTDNSKKGLGGVLRQNGTPIYFARRPISPTESNYQNLECETLGSIWGMEKFHYFLYGNKFTLETEQKPLVSIYWKHLVDVSQRIQRLIVRTLPYNFHVVYVPGKLIPIADALSRNLKFTSEDEEEDHISLPVLAVSYITGNYQQYPDKPVIGQTRQETSKDATLQLLTKYIRNGWSTDQKKLPNELYPYWNYHDELSMEDGILLKSYRILIPYTLQIEMLDLIHEVQQVIEKCLLHSRESLFWPRISNEIH